MISSFQIGVELEVLLSHRKKVVDDFEDLEAFAESLVDDLKLVYSRASRRPRPWVHNGINGIYEGNEGQEWSFTDDVTTKPDDHDQCMPLYSPMSYWAS